MMMMKVNAQLEELTAASHKPDQTLNAAQNQLTSLQSVS